MALIHPIADADVGSRTRLRFDNPLTVLDLTVDGAPFHAVPIVPGLEYELALADLPPDQPLTISIDAGERSLRMLCLNPWSGAHQKRRSLCPGFSRVQPIAVGLRASNSHRARMARARPPVWSSAANSRSAGKPDDDRVVVAQQRRRVALAPRPDLPLHL